MTVPLAFLRLKWNSLTKSEYVLLLSVRLPIVFSRKAKRVDAVSASTPYRPRMAIHVEPSVAFMPVRAVSFTTAVPRASTFEMEPDSNCSKPNSPPPKPINPRGPVMSPESWLPAWPSALPILPAADSTRDIAP